MLFLFLLCRGRIFGLSYLSEVGKIYKICGCFVYMKTRYGSFVLIVLLGLLMAFGVLAKLMFGADIDSDWFWFLAGVGLAVDGVVAFMRQKKFDLKYQVRPRR